MDERFDDARVLIYGNDAYGSAQLQRCAALARALVERHGGLSVLLVSGSPVIGSFHLPSRVDFVRVPGVTRRHNGDYASLSLPMNLTELVALRASIIRHAASAFRPDLMVVEGEPLGLGGELAETLALMESRGALIPQLQDDGIEDIGRRIARCLSDRRSTIGGDRAPTLAPSMELST